MITYISIIIPSLNRPAALRRSLDSILKQNTKGRFEYEIILVLDKLDKESEGWVKQEASINSRLHVYRCEKAGVNSARNLGIKESMGQISYFLDDDCLLPNKDLLLNLAESFKNYPDALAIGGGYILENGEKDIFSISRNKLDNFYVEANINLTGAAGALLGGNIAYKKEVFTKYGCFDENIRYGSAETELNDRILKGRGRLYFMNELSVFHYAPRQNLSTHLLKSSMQGMGKGYSAAKNGKTGVFLNKKPKKFWFIHIAMALNVNLSQRVVAGLFLLINSLFFRVGFLLGRICYCPGVNKHG